MGPKACLHVHPGAIQSMTSPPAPLSMRHMVVLIVHRRDRRMCSPDLQHVLHIQNCEHTATATATRI